MPVQLATTSAMSSAVTSSFTIADLSLVSAVTRTSSSSMVGISA